MDTNVNPSYLIIDIARAYTNRYPEIFRILINESDITEFITQIVDVCINNQCDTFSSNNIVFNMLRCNRYLTPESKDILINIFQELVKEIDLLISNMNVPPIIDMTNGKHIYPYIFHKIINGKLILRRI